MNNNNYQGQGNFQGQGQGANVFNQRNNAQNFQQQEQQRKPKRVKFKAVPFVGEKAGKMITSMDLSALMYDAFSIVFSDFEGCIIVRDQFNNPQVLMYFKDRPARDGMVKAIEPYSNRVTNSPNAAVNRLFAFDARSRNKCYDLTQDAKDILEPFMQRRGNAKINWGQCFEEKWENAYNNSSIVVEIKNLDIIKLVKAIYGSTKIVKDETGNDREDRVDYAISVIRPIVMGFVPNTSGMDVNFLLSIDQLDVREVENLARKLGAVPTNGGGLVMYRGNR